MYNNHNILNWIKLILAKKKYPHGYILFYHLYLSLILVVVHILLERLPKINKSNLAVSWNFYEFRTLTIWLHQLNVPIEFKGCPTSALRKGNLDLVWGTLMNNINWLLVMPCLPHMDFFLHYFISRRRRSSKMVLQSCTLFHPLPLHSSLIYFESNIFFLSLFFSLKYYFALLLLLFVPKTMHTVCTRK